MLCTVDVVVLLGVGAVRGGGAVDVVVVLLGGDAVRGGGAVDVVVVLLGGDADRGGGGVHCRGVGGGEEHLGQLNLFTSTFLRLYSNSLQLLLLRT